jgi:hypothetical protein
MLQLAVAGQRCAVLQAVCRLPRSLAAASHVHAVGSTRLRLGVRLVQAGEGGGEKGFVLIVVCVAAYQGIVCILHQRFCCMQTPQQVGYTPVLSASSAAI